MEFANSDPHQEDKNKICLFTNTCLTGDLGKSTEIQHLECLAQCPLVPRPIPDHSCFSALQRICHLSQSSLKFYRLSSVFSTKLLICIKFNGERPKPESKDSYLLFVGIFGTRIFVGVFAVRCFQEPHYRNL